MSAVEIARARLAHATARRADAKRRVAATPPRHDDSAAVRDEDVDARRRRDLLKH
jgi:hypothetical protein